MEIRFVHAADAHLGYRQYGLYERLMDFTRAFEEFIEKTRELEPDFILFSGDLFDNPHPSNPVVADAIRLIDSVKAPFLVVPGSHDSPYNAAVGSVLMPLAEGRHIWYLPYKPYENERVFVCGIRNFRTRDVFKKNWPSYRVRKDLKPREGKFNVFAFHQALNLPSLGLKGVYEVEPYELPQGFNYYAGGHVHKPFKTSFKGGVLVYPGALETTEYREAKTPKGFFYVEVEGDGEVKTEYIRLERIRKFKILELDVTGVKPSEIEEKTGEVLREADEENVVLVLLLKGTLPPGFKKAQIDTARLKRYVKKALYLKINNELKEFEAPAKVERLEGEKLVEIVEGYLKDEFKGVFGEKAGDYARFTIQLIRLLAERRVNEANTLIDRFYGVVKTLEDYES